MVLRVLGWVLCTVALVAGTASPAEAQLITATAVESAVSVSDAVAQVTFRIQVANDDDALLENVWVVFADGTESRIGDVPGKGTATGEPETHTIDLSEMPSRTISLHVTLKYHFAGKPAEALHTLTVERSEQ